MSLQFAVELQQTDRVESGLSGQAENSFPAGEGKERVQRLDEMLADLCSTTWRSSDMIC